MWELAAISGYQKQGSCETLGVQHGAPLPGGDKFVGRGAETVAVNLGLEGPGARGIHPRTN